MIIPTFLFSKTNSKEISKKVNIKVDKVASLPSVVWGMVFIDDKKLLFTLKSGKIGIVNLNTKEIKYLKNTPDVLYSGQGGLLDVQKSPNYLSDKTLYFTYVKDMQGMGATTLASAKFQDDDLKEYRELLVTKSLTETTRHFGSRITFDEKGHLYFSIGDRGVRPNAQDLTNHAGTIIRLNLDGSIPKDNPFIDRKDVLPEIYSYGHRNPQGLFYDKITNKLWSIEHGPRGGDEINLIQKGKELWLACYLFWERVLESFPVGESTHKEGMQQAIKYYIPSIAPSSLIVYRGNEFPTWNGNLLSGALKLRHLNRIVLDKNNQVLKEERLLKNLEERIRNIIQSSKGEIYISTDSGNIYRLTKKN